MFVNDTTNMDNNYNDISKKYLTTATMYRIDENNCNPFAKWKSMGSPGKPTTAEIMKKSWYPNESTSKPENPEKNFPGNVMRELKSAY